MELKNPLVSILMPAYNCENFVNQAIDSILNQTYENWELLISDDASTDNTKKIIDTYSDKRIKRFHNEANLGYLQTWNKIIQLAAGEYITFQDADDYSSLNRVEKLVNTLNKNQDFGLVGSNCKFITDEGLEVSTTNFHLNHDAIFQNIPFKFNFIGSAIMIRKEVFDQIGGYHLFFDRMGAEDHYWMCLILEKYKMVNLSDSLYYYRFNENSVSGNIANNPSKINIPIVLEHLLKQRKTSGIDDLQKGNQGAVQSLLEELNKPFILDRSYYFYYVAKRRYYEGHKKLAMRILWKAIKISPFRLIYYKDYFYFLRNKQ
jgi:glycosyltransferase involved in cell wall biosynthesis